MATSKVSLANLALLQIGANRIVAFDADQAEARAVAALYDDVRDTVLCEHPWSFAQKRVSLALLATPPVWTDDRIAYSYARPTDFLHLTVVNDPSALVVVEAAGIGSDTPDLKIGYTYRADDPTTYFPAFTMAFATRLAHELCFVLSQSSAKSTALLQKYKTVDLPEALSRDSQQGTPPTPYQDDWLIGRTRGQAVFGPPVPGAQLWQTPW